MRFTIYLQPREAEVLRAAAEVEKRDLRDQIVWLALKALHEDPDQQLNAKGGRDGHQKTA